MKIMTKMVLLAALLGLAASVQAALSPLDNRSDTGFGITADGNVIASSGTFYGTLDAQNGVTVHGGLFIGTDGSKISRAYDADVAVDVTALSAGACAVSTMTVTGASNGDVVTLGVPNALATADANLLWSGWAQADKVNIRFCCIRLTGACADPPVATIEALVIRAK